MFFNLPRTDFCLFFKPAKVSAGEEMILPTNLFGTVVIYSAATGLTL